MASVKVMFRASTVAEREGTIYYQIIHERKVRQLLTSYKIFPSEWDKRQSVVTSSGRIERKPYILSVRESIRSDTERLLRIDRRLRDDGLKYTISDLIDRFKSYAVDYSLFNYMAKLIERLRMNGKIRTSETYKSTLNSFRKFRQGENIMIDSISSEIMESYEAWLQNRDVTPNTISFYTRILRAVYNRAVEDGMVDNCNPFKRVYTGVDKTIKRALPLSMIKRIKRLDLSKSPTLEFARDMFLLSFYLRGMSFIDMAFLKRSDLKNGYIHYRRRKTGQLLIVKWMDEMQSILSKYPGNSSEYLLPIIHHSVTNERSAYRNMSYKINRNLKKIADKVGIAIPLTLYVARHSWASVARSKGIPVSVISEGMGHDSESTTKIYLASLDTSLVDRANSVILKSLK